MELILIFLGCTLMGFIASRITQRNARHREFARQLDRAVAPGCRHPDDQMVPVTALAGDIVAALCGECDEQLELALWQARCDRELQGLDAPESIETYIPPDVDLVFGTASSRWQTYRSRGYEFKKAELVKHDHVRMVIQNEKGCVIELAFRSHLQRLDYMAGRGGGSIHTATHSRSCLGRKPRKTDMTSLYIDVLPDFDFPRPNRFQRIAEQLGIPYDPNESAASFDRRVRKAMDQEKKEIEVIRATEELTAQTERFSTQLRNERQRLQDKIGQAYGVQLGDPEPEAGWMYSDFRAAGWHIKDITEPMGSFGFVEVVLTKDGLFYRRPLTREAYEIWNSR